MNKTLTENNKKQEILDYINVINSGPNQSDPFQFSKQVLMKKFSDDDYSEKRIELLLEELKTEKLLNDGTLKINFYYPRAAKKEVLDRWKKYFFPIEDKLVFAVIWLILIILTQFLFPEQLNSAVYYPLLLFLGYGTFTLIFNLAPKYLPFLSKINMKYLSSVVISLFILLGVAYFWTTLTGEKFTTTILLAIIVGGFAVGSGFYAIFFKKKE
jgi:hypothetical protein